MSHASFLGDNSKRSQRPGDVGFNQLRLVVEIYHYLYTRFFDIAGGCLGCLKINSM